jgi:hypothetical protein
MTEFCGPGTLRPPACRFVEDASCAVNLFSNRFSDEEACCFETRTSLCSVVSRSVGFSFGWFLVRWSCSRKAAYVMMNNQWPSNAGLNVGRVAPPSECLPACLNLSAYPWRTARYLGTAHAHQFQYLDTLEDIVDKSQPGLDTSMRGNLPAIWRSLLFARFALESARQGGDSYKLIRSKHTKS